MTSHRGSGLDSGDHISVFPVAAGHFEYILCENECDSREREGFDKREREGERERGVGPFEYVEDVDAGMPQGRERGK